MPALLRPYLPPPYPTYNLHPTHHLTCHSTPQLMSELAFMKSFSLKALREANAAEPRY